MAAVAVISKWNVERDAGRDGASRRWHVEILRGPRSGRFSSTIRARTDDLHRLVARRNELNAKVRMLREELQHLQESYVGEVVKRMGQHKVLVNFKIG